MAHSYLICGGKEESRLEKASEIIRSFQGKEIKNISVNPDIFIFKEEDSIKIEQIRQLKKNLQLKPYLLKFKVAVINQAEKLTTEAQNALLKTLEEPPENSILILTTGNMELILPTITSRCQIVRLPFQKEFSPDSQKIEANLLKQTLKALSLKVGERLKLAQIVVKSKEQANEFILDQLYLWKFLLREKLLPEKKIPDLEKITLQQIITTIKNIQRANLLIENQINYKLVIDNLLISYPQIKTSY